MPDPTSLTTYLTAVLVGWVGWRLTALTWGNLRAGMPVQRAILRHTTWWMLPGALIQITAVLTVALGLIQYPILDLGWYRLLTGHDGNALVGQTSQPGPWFAVAAVAIPVLILLNLPFLAYAEEKTFREGSETRTPAQRLLRAAKFGLAHCLVGVPLGFGLALTISGLYFDAIYLRARQRTLNQYTKVPPVTPDGTPLTEAYPELDRVRATHATRSGVYTAAAAHTLSNALLLAVVLAAALLSL